MAGNVPCVVKISLGGHHCRRQTGDIGGISVRPLAEMQTEVTTKLEQEPGRFQLLAC
jgi:hypothetical protein